MNALTYDLRTAAATAKTADTAAPKKGFWARAFDAMVESRMRQAERELSMYRHLLPADSLNNGRIKVTYKDAEQLPFVK